MAKLRISSSPDPGLGGAIKDAVGAIRDSLAAGKPPVGSGGREREQAVSNAVDAIAGDESNHSSTSPSNAGAQAQTSDRFNNY